MSAFVLYMTVVCFVGAVVVYGVATGFSVFSAISTYAEQEEQEREHDE